MVKKSKKPKQEKKQAIPVNELYTGLAAAVCIVAISLYYIQDFFAAGSPLYPKLLMLFLFMTALAAVSAFWYCIDSKTFPYYNHLAGLVIAAAGILYLSTVTTGLYLGGDSGHYAGLARSLAKFKGFMELNYIDPQPHILYGFGLPLLLVPANWLFGLNMTAMNVSVALISTGFIAVMFFLMRKYLDKYLLLLFLLALSVNYWLVIFSGVIMTELPFLLFIALTFYAVEKYDDEENIRGFWLMAVVITAYMSYQTKVIGLGVFPAIVIFFLLRKNWKKAALVTGFLTILFLAWNIRNYLAGSLGYFNAFMSFVSAETSETTVFQDTEYGFFGNLVTRPFLKALQGGKFLSPMIFSENSKEVPNYAIYVIMLIIGYIGFLWHAIKKRTIFDISCIIIFAGVSIYGGALFPERWWIPFIPFMLYYTIVGWNLIWDFIGSKISSSMIPSVTKAGLIVILAFSFGIGMKNSSDVVISNHTGRVYPSQPYEAFVEAAKWAKANTPEEAKFASRLDKEFYLFSERQGVNSRAFMSKDYTLNDAAKNEVLTRMRDTLLKFDLDYWILDNTRGDSQMTNIVLSKEQEFFQQVFQIVYAYPNNQPLVYVLKINKEWVEREREKEEIR